MLAHARAEVTGAKIESLAGAPLPETIAALGGCDAFVGNDSGPMHLAAALGTPVTAVFTCTSPLRAGPHGAGHRVVHSGLWCAAALTGMGRHVE